MTNEYKVFDGKRPVGSTGLDRRIILNWILRKYDEGLG
jgi:hypothetical protein